MSLSLSRLSVRPEDLALVLIYIPQSSRFYYVLPHLRVVVLHLLQHLVWDEGEEVETGLLLTEPELIMGIDEAAKEEGEDCEEEHGADAEVVE